MKPTIVESTNALLRVIREIESDAAACDSEAKSLKGLKDELNSYLMATQAMAHRLDLGRIRRAFKHTHLNNGKDDTCKDCGLDLRDSIHTRG